MLAGAAASAAAGDSRRASFPLLQVRRLVRSGALAAVAGMAAGALRGEQNTRHDDNSDDRRRADAAEIEAATGERLGQQVAHGGAERPGEDERGPEQPGGRDPGRSI